MSFICIGSYFEIIEPFKLEKKDIPCVSTLEDL